MPVIKFDYLARPHVDNKKLVAVYRPIIPIRLSGNHKIYPYTVNCLVDAGADFNLLPAHIGEYFGFKIKSGEKVTHMGIGNVGILAYEHPVTLYIQSYKIKTKIQFSYDHQIPLLGRYSFFSFFKRITFYEKQLQLQLEY